MNTSCPPSLVLQAGPFDPEDLADLQGCFRNGYTEFDVEWAFGLLARVTGVNLGVLWGYVDTFGFGGDSDYVALVKGLPYEIQEGGEDLFAFLLGDNPNAPAALTLGIGAPISCADGQGRNFPKRDLAAN